MLCCLQVTDPQIFFGMSILTFSAFYCDTWTFPVFLWSLQVCALNTMVLQNLCSIKFPRFGNSLQVMRPDCLFESQMICFTEWLSSIEFHFLQHCLSSGIIFCHGWNAHSCTQVFYLCIFALASSYYINNSLSWNLY